MRYSLLREFDKRSDAILNGDSPDELGSEANCSDFLDCPPERPSRSTNKLAPPRLTIALNLEDGSARKIRV